MKVVTVILGKFTTLGILSQGLAKLCMWLCANNVSRQSASIVDPCHCWVILVLSNHVAKLSNRVWQNIVVVVIGQSSCSM